LEITFRKALNGSSCNEEVVDRVVVAESINSNSIGKNMEGEPSTTSSDTGGEKRRVLPVFVGLSALVIVVWWTYLPGTELFFRNDDWNLMGVLCRSMFSESGGLNDLASLLVYGDNPEVRHFVPIAVGMAALKFLVFGDRFPLHFGLSLICHICNILLVYMAVLRISSDRMASMLGAAFFACAAIISDTIFWPLQLAFISVTMVTLGSIVLHPALAIQKPGRIRNIAFYVITAMAPFIFELGLVTILLAMAIFVVHRKVKLFPFAMLTAPVAACLLARTVVKSVTTGVYFCGIPQLILNVGTGVVKLVMGLFGAVFSIKVTDTLYILVPDVWNPHTLFSMFLLLISTFCIWRFLRSPDLSASTKAQCVVLLVASVVPFAMTSFACDPSNPNPDLSHQMPRYYYLCAALVIIPLVHSLRFTLHNAKILLLCAAMIALSGISSTRYYMYAIRVFSDDLQQVTVTYKRTGHFPIRTHSGIQVDPYSPPYRLDWSFNENNVRCYFTIGNRSLLGTRGEL
jgi:hypothetical protein